MLVYLIYTITFAARNLKNIMMYRKIDLHMKLWIENQSLPVAFNRYRPVFVLLNC